MIFRLRKIEGQAHYPPSKKVVIGPKIGSSTDFSVIKKMPIEIFKLSYQVLRSLKITTHLQLEGLIWSIIKWSASLNTIHANLKDMFIIFNWKEKHYKLQGVRSTNSSTASLQSLNKLVENPSNPIQTLLDEFQLCFRS